MITFYKGDAATIFDQVTEGEVTVGPEKAIHITDGCFYVTFSDSSTGGAVEIATAPDRGYKGQWAVRAVVAWERGGRTHWVGVHGVHLALRIRISEPIKHGTVSVYGVGTKG